MASSESDPHDPALLEAILSTAELRARPSRPPDHVSENQALTELAGALAASPATILQRLSEVALRSFGAGSAGVSLLSEDGRSFHWPAIAGLWKPHAGGGIARHASPCGIVVDRGTVELMTRPYRLFAGAADVEHPIEEILLAPFSVEGRVVGTVWLLAHDRDRHFDAEDQRKLLSIARFAAGAYQVQAALASQETRRQEFHAGDRRRAFLLRLSDALRTLTDAGSIQLEAMRLLGEHLGVMRAQFYEVSSDGAYLESLGGYADGAASITEPLRLEDFAPYLTDALREGRTLAVPEVARDPHISPREREAYERIGSRAFVGVPLIKRGRFVAGLGLHHGTPRAWPAADLALAEETTERAWVAIERARAEQALRDADRRKNEFLAMLAHELRTPLAAIHNAGRLLEHAQGNESLQRSAAGILNRQTGHMVRLVDDLLDVSRITQGKIALRKERTDLSSVVRNAVEGSRGYVQVLASEITVSLPSQPVLVCADPVRLTQVIGNLLNNALKFTHDGGRVQVSVEQEDGQATIRVKDAGIGIAAAELPRIFDLFAQVDGSSMRVHDGLGLGLSLVKSLVQMHDGTVEARSDGIGRGAEFVVRLPTVAASPSPEPSVTPTQSVPVTSRRVLVVDDNADVAESLSLLIRMWGHQVEIAHDGVEAIERAAAFDAEVILMDIGMPQLDGYTAARRIALTGRAKLIVALTGWGQPDDRARSRSAGFDAHLVKPVDMRALAALFSGLDAKV